MIADSNDVDRFISFLKVVGTVSNVIAARSYRLTLNVSGGIVYWNLIFSTLVEIVDVCILVVEDSRTRCNSFLASWKVGIYCYDFSCVEVCIELVCLYLLHNLSGDDTFLD
jgi:hypothetical protein